MSLWSPAPPSAPQKVATTLKEKIQAEAQERATFHVKMLKTKWTDVLWEWRQITKGKNYLGAEEGGQNILQFNWSKHTGKVRGFRTRQKKPWSPAQHWCCLLKTPFCSEVSEVLYQPLRHMGSCAFILFILLLLCILPCHLLGRIWMLNHKSET